MVKKLYDRLKEGITKTREVKSLEAFLDEMKAHNLENVKVGIYSGQKRIKHAKGRVTVSLGLYAEISDKLTLAWIIDEKDQYFPPSTSKQEYGNWEKSIQTDYTTDASLYINQLQEKGIPKNNIEFEVQGL